MRTKLQDNNPTPPQTAPDAATYKASENVPSIRTLLPAPKFPVQPAPESAQVPAGITFDKTGSLPSNERPVVGTIVGRQEVGSFLQTPTKFNPVTREFEPVAPSTELDAKPAVARPKYATNPPKLS